MAGDRVDVNWRVGGAADRRTGDDRILEGRTGENVRGLEVFADDLDGAAAGLISDLPALAVWGWDCAAARQRHAERLGQRIIGRSSTHRVAMPGRRRRARDDID